MHEALGTVHSAAEDGPRHWCPRQTPSTGILPVKVPDRIGGNTIVLEGFARSRGDRQDARIERDQLVHRDLVVAEDPDVRAEFAKVLDEVVGEKVVIIMGKSV